MIVVTGNNNAVAVERWMVAIVVETQSGGGPGGAVELEVGCFELEVSSSQKKKGHGSERATGEKGAALAMRPLS